MISSLDFYLHKIISSSVAEREQSIQIPRRDNYRPFTV